MSGERHVRLSLGVTAVWEKILRNAAQRSMEQESDGHEKPAA
jgi:hypothetical protein